MRLATRLSTPQGDCVPCDEISPRDVNFFNLEFTWRTLAAGSALDDLTK